MSDINNNGVKRLTLTLASSCILAIGSANAAIVKAIKVDGSSRVSEDAIRSNITITPGKEFSADDIDDSVKQLYALGLFSKVSISVSSSTLVVAVSESRIVNQVVFNGNRKIKDTALQAIVATAPGRALDNAKLSGDVAAIKQAYAKIGRDEIDVTTSIATLDETHTNVAFVINEGERTKIADITFAGNQAYDSGRLRSVISTKKSNILSFLTRKDVYDEERLHADEAALSRFYFNQGFADFRIISSHAEKNDGQYSLSFGMDEGPRYRFGALSISSRVRDLDQTKLLALLPIHTGDIYSAQKLQKSVDLLSDAVLNGGHIFAKVSPRGSRDLPREMIDVEFDIDETERSYVERIEIQGNARTRDYILRREIDISEGDAFNQNLLTKAKRRLEALGYFKSVNLTTRPGSDPNKVVVVIDVEDDATGSFSIGAGVGSDDGVTLSASVEEKNFLGRGQYIKLAASGGVDDSDRSYSFAFTEPYLLGNRIAVGFDVNYSETSYDDYDYDESGFTLRASTPISEDLASTFRYNFKRMNYSNGTSNLSDTYTNLMENGPWVRSSVSNTLTYSTLDNMKQPRDGMSATLTQEIAGLGGDSRYYKVSGKARYYNVLQEDADIIGSVSVGAGHIVAFGNSLNIYDQFMLGGSEIRGFASKGIGARIAGADDQQLGGTTYFTASLEASFPLPAIPRDSGFRGAVFLDGGTLYGNKVDVLGSDVAEGTSGALRASAGVSLIWDSPFGALRLDYALPFAKQDSDDVQQFKFGINNQF